MENPDKAVTAVNAVLTRMRDLRGWYEEHQLQILTLSARDYDTLKKYPSAAQRAGVLFNIHGDMKFRELKLKRGPGAPLL